MSDKKRKPISLSESTLAALATAMKIAAFVGNDKHCEALNADIKFAEGGRGAEDLLHIEISLKVKYFLSATDDILNFRMIFSLEHFLINYELYSVRRWQAQSPTAYVIECDNGTPFLIHGKDGILKALNPGSMRILDELRERHHFDI